MTDKIVAQLGKIRSVASTEVQTECSFVPSCVNMSVKYDAEASEQYSNLLELRDMIEKCLRDVAGTVYDVTAFKDIMFKLEEQFSSSTPVTDMLLLTSKLFRKTSELGRLLGCFFGVVFADQHADEHFHFSEVRLLQKELRDVRKQLKEAEEENTRLQQMLTNIGQVAMDHGKAVELLEDQNRALQVQTTALEDQMALLFHQMNADLEKNCKEAYEKVSLDVELQEKLNPTRNTFRQTMDSLGQQVRSSRALITEVREALLQCSQGQRTGDAYVAIEPSVRFKLKMLDTNFQQIVGRFTSVKDTVAETAHELMSALQERKKILYLSYQHIRLYDLQNAKLREGKAVLADLREYTTDLLQKIHSTFPPGAITSVDRLGRFATQRWQGGYTLAALRENKMKKASSSNTNINQSTTEKSGGGLTLIERMAAESEMAALERAAAGANDNAGHAILPSTTVFDEPEKTAPPFDSVFDLIEVIRMLDSDIMRLNGALTLEDEMTAFLKTITLSVSTTERLVDKGTLQGEYEQLESKYDQALIPSGSLQSANRRRSSFDGLSQKEDSVDGKSELGMPLSHMTSNVSVGEKAQAEGLLSKQAQQLRHQQEQLAKMQDDFSSKLGFLRQVYEARITDLEMKEAAVHTGFGGGHSDVSASVTVPANNLNSTARAAGVPSPPTILPPAAKKRGGGKNELKVVRSGDVDEEMEALKRKTDVEQLSQARGEWQKEKPAVMANKKLREAAVSEIDKIQTDVLEKEDQRIQRRDAKRHL
ncbi:hypothetical protein STCU_08968 [Strigomonas culicis]|uniref:Uncharacterized protein n=1 Tax=Strigomonas culicis TaxID=28005 RepID=S9TQ92_9TRYP|nr:hypothetical protein STCU_08968 [Strigomonas culicis]|eukprot:EPY20502.1 hypothetical protein STCU_08968 [Strigomonas culicis]